MIFIVERVTSYGEKPCKEAFIKNIPYWDIRTTTEEEFNKKFGLREGVWLSKGRNHRKVNDNKYIAREKEDRETWCVEISTLDDLVSFVTKYGDIIIENPYFTKIEGVPLTIIIYDDYVE